MFAVLGRRLVPRGLDRPRDRGRRVPHRVRFVDRLHRVYLAARARLPNRMFDLRLRQSCRSRVPWMADFA